MSADQPGELSERAINAAKGRRRYMEAAIRKEVGKVAKCRFGRSQFNPQFRRLQPRDVRR
jgi:hypothetical protein